MIDQIQKKNHQVTRENTTAVGGSVGEIPAVGGSVGEAPQQWAGLGEQDAVKYFFSFRVGWSSDARSCM